MDKNIFDEKVNISLLQNMEDVTKLIKEYRTKAEMCKNQSELHDLNKEYILKYKTAFRLYNSYDGWLTLPNNTTYMEGDKIYCKFGFTYDEEAFEKFYTKYK